MAKRILSLILCCALLSGCTAPYVAPPQTTTPQPETTVPVTVPAETPPVVETQPVPEEEILVNVHEPGALTKLEEQIYTELVLTLDSTEYFVENVEVTYISSEYLAELEFNSQPNIYFGYSLKQLNEFFEGKQYIFTLSEEGETVVRELTQPDNTFNEIVKNVAIGTAVILVSATVVCIKNGQPINIANLFTCAVKMGTVPAGKFIGGMLGTIVANRDSENLEQLVKENALEGSETFKWGALSASAKAVAGVLIPLQGSASNGLNTSESAKVQQESTLPLEFIKNFHSMEEYQVYQNAGLVCQKVNGQWAYVRDIDWDFLDDEGRTNAQRVQEGLSPLDSEGVSYELHHIGQRTDSPLAILTSREHEENFAALHANTGETQGEQPSQGSEWTQQRRDFWKALLAMYLATAA